MTEFVTEAMTDFVVLPPFVFNTTEASARTRLLNYGNAIPGIEKDPTIMEKRSARYSLGSPIDPFVPRLRILVPRLVCSRPAHVGRRKTKALCHSMF